MPGHKVRILYKGQHVGQERIERACRRQKIILPLDIGRSGCPSVRFRIVIVCTVQPTHIEVQVLHVPAYSSTSDNLLSQHGHPNESVIENTFTIDDIERQACRQPCYAKVQEHDTLIKYPDLGPIVLEHGDIQSLISPLELCKSHLLRSLDHPLLQKPVNVEPVTARLIKLLQSQWLLSAMNNLLCWAYKMMARRSCQLLGASHDFNAHSGSVKEPDDKGGMRSCKAPETPKDTAASLCHATSRSQLLVTSSTGTISVRYSSVFGTNQRTMESEEPLALALAFMPSSKDRTVGVSMMFGDIQDIVGAEKISPHIRTFNVIPKDSAIIKSVLHDDLEGAQTLFASGEASPLDVDPDGFSLLSVHD